MCRTSPHPRKGFEEDSPLSTLAENGGGVSIVPPTFRRVIWLRASILQINSLLTIFLTFLLHFAEPSLAYFTEFDPQMDERLAFAALN